MIRWSGLWLIIGGILVAVTSAMRFPTLAKKFDSAVAVLRVVFSILVMLGLQGMYLRQSSARGWLALPAHLLLEAGMIYFLYLGLIRLRHPSDFKQIAEQSPVHDGLFMVLAIGLLASGLVTVRAHVFPVWSGILMLVSGVTASVRGLVPLLFYFPLALALASIGFCIWTS